jgi:hypothetical protein
MKEKAALACSVNSGFATYGANMSDQWLSIAPVPAICNQLKALDLPMIGRIRLATI